MATLEGKDKNGVTVQIGTTRGRLHTDNRVPELVANEAGLAYVARTPTAGVDPTAAGDYIFYLENKPSSGVMLHISRVHCSSVTVDDTLIFDWALATDNILATPTTGTMVGMNALALPGITYTKFETDPDLLLLDGSGNIVGYQPLEASNGLLDTVHVFPEHVIIPPGYAFRVQSVIGGSVLHIAANVHCVHTTQHASGLG
ncbi:MAG TPA: hypothetical protein VNA25_27120 [Phycisphaerae bacterium]|nr:hypothetical protein [Phycisphaerae bacterium]